jgi:hypothetical protein
MIGYGHAVHSVLSTFFKEVGDTDGSVEEAILGVYVKMGEAGAHIGCPVEEKMKQRDRPRGVNTSRRFEKGY